MPSTHLSAKFQSLHVALVVQNGVEIASGKNPGVMRLLQVELTEQLFISPPTLSHI